MNGLLDMINLAAYFDIRCDIWLPEQRGIDAFTAYTEMQAPNGNGGRTPFRLIRPGVFFDNGVLRVKSVQTDHMAAPCYGFLLEADGARLYITGDLHPTLRDFPALLYEEHTDMIVTECAHFTPEALYATLKKCRTDAVAVIHVMPAEKYAGLRESAVELPFRILFPSDGDVLRIG